MGYTPNVNNFFGLFVTHSSTNSALNSTFWGQNLSVLQKGLLMQDWVLRLEFGTIPHEPTHLIQVNNNKM